jgi:secretion/DNA translocation related TadE-like protein
MDESPVSPSSPERGVATVWAVTWMTACAAIATIVAAVGVATARQHEIDAAADLAALAGASAIQHGGEACAAAAATAASNNSELHSCEINGDEIEITANGRVYLLGLKLRLTSQARAGPTSGGLKN